MVHDISAKLKLAAGVSRQPTREPAVFPCSRVRGRERWYVEAVEDNPRLAASVTALLRSEEGIEQAQANPLTGRVLVVYDPELREPVEVLIRRAVAFGPMTSEEFSLLQPPNSEFSLAPFLAAEIGCAVFKLLLFGSCCPASLGAAGLALLVAHRVGTSRSCREEVSTRARSRRLISDQSGRVRDHQDRAQIMQHGGDDRIDCPGSSEIQAD
jgi:hypothetical protein